MDCGVNIVLCTWGLVARLSRLSPVPCVHARDTHKDTSNSGSLYICVCEREAEFKEGSLRAEVIQPGA